MTAFVAIRTVDGVVLASESMTGSYESSFRELRCKLVRHPTGAWTSSWYIPKQAIALPAGFVDGGWIAWSVIQLACACRPPGLYASAEPHLYFAGRDDAGHPALLRWQDGECGQWAPPGVYLGGLFTCPAETGIVISPPPVPETVDEARELAAGLVHDFIAAYYAREGRTDLDDYLRAGVCPPVAAPVHVATITAEAIHLEEVRCK